MRLLFAVLIITLIWGCTQPAKDHVRHHEILAFGTIINVTIRHHDDQLVDQAFKRLETDFLTMHRVWHPWEPGPLTRTNQLLQTGEWFTASTSILPLLKLSKTLSLQSFHFFNPAIGKLVGLWGFHRNNPDQPFAPDMQKIRLIQADIPNMDDVEIDGIRLRGHNPHLQLDLGGIAKGFGIDQAFETLQSLDIKHAIINAGGDLRAVGQHQDRPWTIGIQHPRQSTVLASIETLRDESIFTSGDYQRYYMQDSQRRHHIIDPRTGEPVSHTIAVTVIHPQAVVADAAATALLAGGKENMARIARSMGVEHVMLMSSDGEISLTEKMQQRLRLNEQLKLKLDLIAL